MGGRLLFQTRLTTFKITLTVVEVNMEANHPVFLPRLVPHVFDLNHRSSARLTMPDSNHRSPLPMSTSNHTGTPIPTLPKNFHPSQDPTKMRAILSALDLEATASVFLLFYHVAPQGALSALEILVAGDSQSNHTFSLLMKQLFIAGHRRRDYVVPPSRSDWYVR